MKNKKTENKDAAINYFMELPKIILPTKRRLIIKGSTDKITNPERYNK